MTVNDEKVSLDTAPVIIDDRTLVPLRAVSEALDCNVDWDGDTKTVAIAPHKYNEYYTQKLIVLLSFFAVIICLPSMSV